MNLGPSKIPPMTNPMGIHWEQPSNEDIVIDDTHALMTKATREAIRYAYLTSVPSGVYAGKMWISWEEAGQEGLSWFGEVKRGKCTKYTREILIAD